MPKDQTQFFIEEVQELKSWHRVLSRGALAGVLFAVVFAIFIVIWGISVIISAAGDWMPQFSVILKTVSKIVELVAFVVFGVGGAVATKKMGIVGLYSLLKDHMERVDKSSVKNVDEIIGFTCERCGAFMSNNELEMIQKGAPIACPNGMCSIEENDKRCLYTWARNLKQKENGEEDA